VKLALRLRSSQNFALGRPQVCIKRIMYEEVMCIRSLYAYKGYICKCNIKIIPENKNETRRENERETGSLWDDP